VRISKWYRVFPRFSLEIAAGGFVGLGITFYWTPKRRHYQMYLHLLVGRIVLAWHRRNVPPAKEQK